ncbi:MAG: sugar phosphate isomerase/epimerase family protein [Planctomycetota bacterium]
MTERISIVTDEISTDLAVCRDFLDRHGVGAVELRCVGEGRAPDLAPADRRTLRAWARAAAPAIIGVSPGLFQCAPDDRKTIRDHLRERLPRALDLARDISARFVVAFSFEPGAPDPSTAFPSAALDALAAAADEAAAAGLPLLVENEPGFLACTGEETAALLEAVGHESLFANWDPANAGDLGREALARGLRALAPRLAHVHVKNGRTRPGRRFPVYGPLGAGDIDWPAHLALLDALGYTGYLGVETHHEPRLEASAIVLAELRALRVGTGR